jgi:hypothetical protein
MVGFRRPRPFGPTAGRCRSWHVKTAQWIAGHGRLLAGKAEGAAEVPVIVARGWTEEQCRAYALADNKLSLNSELDDEALAAATHRRPDPHDACGRKTGPRDLRVGSTAAFRLER